MTFNKLRTKTAFPPPGRYQPARCRNPNVGFVEPSQRHPETIRSHPRIINPYVHLQLQQTDNKNGICPGRHRPETPPWDSQIKRHPARMRFRPQIGNPSMLLQMQHTGNERGIPPGRYRPQWCGNPNLGFAEPAHPRKRSHPRIRTLSVYNSSTPGTKTAVPRIDTRPARCGNPNMPTWGSYCQRHPGRIRSHLQL